MRKELYSPFLQICTMSKEITAFDPLTDEQFSKVFDHVSNIDMETTIRTMRYAYHAYQTIKEN